MQGDMILAYISVYDIFRGDHQSLRDLFTINKSRTRGHDFKLCEPLIQTIT